MSSKPPRAPIINAPPLLAALVIVFLIAHGVRAYGGDSINLQMLYHGAVYPERFWGTLGMGDVIAGVNSAPAYNGPIPLVFSLFATAFLHGDWLHVVLNSAIFVAAGKPVYEAFSQGRGGGATLFLSLFFLSVGAGSLLYLAGNYPDGPIAIGASGGVSGIIAAVLLMQGRKSGGPPARILSAPFLRVSAAFIIGNLILWVAGPAILGMNIAWQAHIGGYIMGAVFYRWVCLARG